MRKLFTFFAAVLLTASVFAQAPEKMSYQAVIRNSSDALVTNTQIGMQISILQGSASGTSVYVETQTPTTNANGLVSIEIGAGTVVSGDFTTIDWANGTYFIKTETAVRAPLTSYTITGTSQLLSVPYALFAKNSSGWSTNGDSVFTFKHLGIKTSKPEREFHLIGAARIQAKPAYAPYMEFYKSDGITRHGYTQLGGNWEFVNEIPSFSIYFRTASNKGPNLWIADDGNIGINNISPKRSLHIKDVLRLEPRSTEPTNPSKGDVYFDNNTNKLRVYDGTVWQNCW